MNDEIYLDAEDLPGTISEVKLEESEGGATWALSRVAQGMLADVLNPPADLFDRKHFPNYRYAWRRVGGDRFELDLGLSVSKPATKCRSLERFAADIRQARTNDVNDSRYKAFDAVIGLTIYWVEKLLERPWYEEHSIGLITPQNVLVVESDHWDKYPARPFLVDLGFCRHGGGDPNQVEWLSPTGKFHFLSPKGDPYQSYSESWSRRDAIACLSRLIAYVLEPLIGVGRQARFERLSEFSEPAGVWSVLNRAVQGKFGDDLAAFRKELGQPLNRPSIHFASTAPLGIHPAPVPPPPPPPGPAYVPPPQALRPRRSPWPRVVSVVLLLAIVGGLGVVAWQWPRPGPPCECCPAVAAQSPLVGPLKRLDELLRKNGISVGPTRAEPSTAVAAAAGEPAKLPNEKRLPVREQAKPLELELIAEIHQAAGQWQSQFPEKSLSTAESECLQRLRNEYRDLLREQFALARNWEQPTRQKNNQQISEELKQLRKTGEVVKQPWEHVLQRDLPRNIR